jgi:SAM-dependent methyltransferase
MTPSTPGEVLRHRGPALLVGGIERFDGETLCCTSSSRGPWSWPHMLEGAAQCAGLLAGLQPRGLSQRALIAEYRGILVHAAEHAGAIRFVARIERRVLHFWRCRIEARAADGLVLLEGSVTLAPEPAASVAAWSASTPDPRLYAILAEAGFGEALFNPRQHRSCELVDRYVFHLAIDVTRRLGLCELLARPFAAEELLAAGGFVPRFRRPLHWLLEWLAAAGLVTRDDAGRYRTPASLPATGLAALRAEALAADASYAPTFALLDEAAAIYPAVARGETSAEDTLFRKAALWFAYFSNANAYYALNNRVTAHAAATRLPPEAAVVLEVGAGLGSATEALLERLREAGMLPRLCSYRATEPVALFRRRAQRTLGVAHRDVPLVFSDLDINRPWADQGIAPRSAHLVWGVNVFHLARDLDAVLRDAFEALAPGGWLVVGEGLRPFRGQPVAAEFPFQILESFVDVELDPETRSTPGFLTAEEWLGALGRAGFSERAIVPDAIRLRAVHPAFFAAAVCGRRPLLTA